MKVVILAGGLGTRLSEETILKPKPMVEIGGMPILWHIMKIYSHYGFTDFVVCLGYKGYLIKEYFANYYLHKSNVTINLANNDVKVHDTKAEPWNITLVDTGLETMTGGRLKRVKEYLNGEPFMLTYGDGVADIDVNELVAFHESHGKLITLTSVQPEGRFGLINFDDSQKILSFQEKPKGDGGWSNGGFFVCQPEVIDYLEDDTTIFERAPLENLAKDGQLFAYKHHGFWKPMDTVRDKAQLEEMIASGTASWIKW
ncbi:glucose-1-phosphate cytidylyltransferase [Mucilaginibacter rubeus]|uniref:Glucose-1-phosphate cytidylyltransferase n=1 Tax=Mucilaginibacter rubeus TaxID=2027860 RepID=A0AAE6JBJ5_9SPHI|nr:MULTISPECIES: glucose-1-phosphate cytidylyltransferase [Mucilaginibacter]QEM02040.1 glucose-1-phosphate cytidylyltransferase [Mucilaginibacter rubeus]QEM14665.1 glucose-1-phosphate cytidylyltransferase [Mucilaginibacter gossypii]QTE42627.1 glucose-1-phosphate cytidylyltransferase [Mucilaginibacter rubeus]QTE49228.1 glucose-1-phosphate cytidylyltransferase [Mucilaginibacter rubeus]QTE54325.1 glucose-1-phosphate cytidylyltransferase [Mucilaginibacter rubeus]